MVILCFIQEDEPILYAAFDSEKTGREFAKQLPGYRLEKEEYEGEFFETELLDLDKLPDYVEISYKGKSIPFSRFMFSEDSDPEIFWRSIPQMDEPGEGMVEGAIRVDAYLVGNDEAKEYIEGREARVDMVVDILDQMGYSSFRQFQGSEDGEALYVQKREGGDGLAHFLGHLDPFFLDLPLDEEALRAWVEENLVD